MVRRKAALLATVLLGVLLSGCIGSDDVKSGTGDAAAAVVTATTGSVTGQVLSLDLEPVPDLDIGLLNRTGGLQISATDRRGNFTFNGMEAGQYRLQVADDCCRPYTEQITVTAGKVTVVNLQVEPLSDADLKTPFVSEYVWEGFIGCGVGILSTNIEPCERTDDNSDMRLPFNVSAGIEELRVGLDWKPAGTTVNNELKIQLRKVNASVCARNMGSAAGPPPLYLELRDSRNQCEDTWFAIINGTMDLELNVGTGVNNFVYQQTFIVYRSEFYHHLAPAGYDPIPERL